MQEAGRGFCIGVSVRRLIATDKSTAEWQGRRLAANRSLGVGAQLSALYLRFQSPI